MKLQICLDHHRLCPDSPLLLIIVYLMHYNDHYWNRYIECLFKDYCNKILVSEIVITKLSSILQLK